MAWWDVAVLLLLFCSGPSAGWWLLLASVRILRWQYIKSQPDISIKMAQFMWGDGKSPNL